MRHDLSLDARTVATCCFLNPKTILGFGLQKSRPTGRVFVALTELERAGYIERVFRDDGGIDYRPLKSLRPIHLPESKLINFPLVEPLT